MQFKHVICGGTFDHLHLGHKKLLRACFEAGEQVTIGVTSGAFARHKLYPYSLGTYMQRVENVRAFAAEEKKQVTIVKLTDVYGLTLENSSFDALFVTKDTLHGAEMIQKKRIELGMKPLIVKVVPLVFDEMGEKLSSERIRQGVVNREGRSYCTSLFSKEQHILPESLKGRLRTPLGRVIPSFSALSKKDKDKLKHDAAKRGYLYQCAVGDIVTDELKKRKITPHISIIDGMTKRKALKTNEIEQILEKDRYDAINTKGTIQKNACLEVQKLFQMGHGRATRQLFIHGEEDLLTLVAVLFAPLGGHVWYGQRGVGAVDVRVTEKKKETVYNLLRQFN